MAGLNDSVPNVPETALGDYQVEFNGLIWDFDKDGNKKLTAEEQLALDIFKKNPSHENLVQAAAFVGITNPSEKAAVEAEEVKSNIAEAIESLEEQRPDLEYYLTNNTDQVEARAEFTAANQLWLQAYERLLNQWEAQVALSQKMLKSSENLCVTMSQI